MEKSVRIISFRLASLTVAAAVGLFGCTKKDAAAPTESSNKTAFKVGLVLDRGGRDDKSFNSAAYKGAMQAVKDFGVELKDVEPSSGANFEPALRNFAERGFPLVIAIGFSQKDPVAKVAPQFPNTKFAIVDAPIELPNVQSLMFAEHEGSYMVGYLAALATKTNTIGFVGGMDIPLIKRFQMGYQAGAKAAKKDVKILVNYVGNTADAWANPARGKELALSQYASKADVIFAAAGASSMGVFDAAEEKKLYAIGVDSNQNWIKPGRILSSMLKRVDEAVYNAIKEAANGQFKSGVQSFGLKDKGVDFAVDEHNQNLIAPHMPQLEKVRADIISGTIKVPDYYLTQKK